MSKLSKKRPRSIKSRIVPRRPARTRRPLPPGRPAKATRPPVPSRPKAVIHPTPQVHRRPGAASSFSTLPTMQQPAAHYGEAERLHLEELYRRWETIANRISLATVADRLEDVDQAVATLPTQIAKLRERGYLFHGEMEEQAQILLEQWTDRREAIFRRLEMESRRLHQEAEQVGRLLNEAARVPHQIAIAERRLQALETMTGEAEQGIIGSFDQIDKDLRQLQRKLNQAAQVLEVLGSVSFPLLPEEHGIAVTKAAWLVQGGEPMQGYLILTDSRLLFEQREEVVTKKVLLFFKEKETIQKLQWQAPIGAVQVVGVQDKGGFLRRHQELLTLRMEGGDAPPQVTLNLQGATNEAWAALIRHAQAGELSMVGQSGPTTEAPAEETGESSTPAPTQADEVPTTCPHCGAPLPTIYKGMQQITCEYCGSLIRL